MQQQPSLASLIRAIGGIDQFYRCDALIAFDLEDVEGLNGLPGEAFMGAAQAWGPDRPMKAFEGAVACLCLEGVDLAEARGVMVLITGSRDSLKLGETRNVIEQTRRCAADDAHVIFGTAFDDGLGDQLRVAVFATGLGRAGMRQVPVSVVDDAPTSLALQATQPTLLDCR